MVSRLEGPCRHHIHAPTTGGNESSGHALTITAPLVHLSSPQHHLPGETITWEAPTAIFDRLLILSRDLVLGEEFTPIQAWDYLQQHNVISGLAIAQLQELTEKALRYVECHG